MSADGYSTSVPVKVAEMFEDLAWKVWEIGFDKYSARAILQRIRWHYQVDRGLREFKCNNNWTPGMARVFMKKYPTMRGFFEIRNRKGHVTSWDD
jgi:hypothetical protein